MTSKSNMLGVCRREFRSIATRYNDLDGMYPIIDSHINDIARLNNKTLDYLENNYKLACEYKNTENWNCATLSRLFFGTDDVESFIKYNKDVHSSLTIDKSSFFLGKLIESWLNNDPDNSPWLEARSILFASIIDKSTDWGIDKSYETGCRLSRSKMQGNWRPILQIINNDNNEWLTNVIDVEDNWIADDNLASILTGAVDYHGDVPEDVWNDVIEQTITILSNDYPELAVDNKIMCSAGYIRVLCSYVILESKTNRRHTPDVFDVVFVRKLCELTICMEQVAGDDDLKDRIIKYDDFRIILRKLRTGTVPMRILAEDYLSDSELRK